MKFNIKLINAYAISKEDNTSEIKYIEIRDNNGLLIQTFSAISCACINQDDNQYLLTSRGLKIPINKYKNLDNILVCNETNNIYKSIHVLDTVYEALVDMFGEDAVSYKNKVINEYEDLSDEFITTFFAHTYNLITVKLGTLISYRSENEFEVFRDLYLVFNLPCDVYQINLMNAKPTSYQFVNGKTLPVYCLNYKFVSKICLGDSFVNSNLITANYMISDYIDCGKQFDEKLFKDVIIDLVNNLKILLGNISDEGYRRYTYNFNNYFDITNEELINLFIIDPNKCKIIIPEEKDAFEYLQKKSFIYDIKNSLFNKEFIKTLSKYLSNPVYFFETENSIYNVIQYNSVKNMIKREMKRLINTYNTKISIEGICSKFKDYNDIEQDLYNTNIVLDTFKNDLIKLQIIDKGFNDDLTVKCIKNEKEYIVYK